MGQGGRTLMLTHSGKTVQPAHSDPKNSRRGSRQEAATERKRKSKLVFGFAAKL